jgi:hypothetical protein
MLAADNHAKNLDDMIHTHLNQLQQQGKITLQTSSSQTYGSQCQTISWQAIPSPTFTPSPIKERS